MFKHACAVVRPVSGCSRHASRQVSGCQFTGSTFQNEPQAVSKGFLFGGSCISHLQGRWYGSSKQEQVTTVLPSDFSSPKMTDRCLIFCLQCGFFTKVQVVLEPRQSKYRIPPLPPRHHHHYHHWLTVLCGSWPYFGCLYHFFSPSMVLVLLVQNSGPYSVLGAVITLRNQTGL